MMRWLGSPHQQAVEASLYVARLRRVLLEPLYGLPLAPLAEA
jgi:hypothetical protein